LGAWPYERFGINLIFTQQEAVIVVFPLVPKAARAAFEEVSRSTTGESRTRA